ncbi:hypothetical protein KBY90_02795 [Cyanobium sp. CH-040]|nr:hypothetical protein [Cyanobium sp. CH-040]
MASSAAQSEDNLKKCPLPGAVGAVIADTINNGVVSVTSLPAPCQQP